MKRLLLSTLGIAVFAAANGSTALAGLFDPDVHDRGLTMSDYMRQVPGGGQPGGPAYDFGMGMYEITNAQFAEFLNDAQLDGGATGRGTNMYFQDDGRVRVSPTGPTIFRAQPASFSQIQYNAAVPLGQRFTVATKDGMSMGPHPVVLASWYGAAKFANWLTLDQGLGPGERAYTEGPNPQDWHPATITTADWQARDLNADERQSLVDEFLGFRLPMDDHSSGASAFNEFYKASAWDPGAQVNHTYGFGRDTIDNRDANGALLNPNGEPGQFRDDPFEVGMDPDTTPVGFYDGTLWQRSDWNWPDTSPSFDTFQTRANGNAIGIFDLSGNLEEWMQDGWENPPSRRTTRGGAWENDESLLRGAYREPHLPAVSDEAIGFRIVRVPEPTTIAYLGIGLLVFKRARRASRMSRRLRMSNSTPSNLEISHDKDVLPQSSAMGFRTR